MAMSGLLVCVLMAALVRVGLTSPVSKSDGNTKQGGILPQLLARREAVRNAAENMVRTAQDTQTSMARMERMAHLSEDQREFMSKQIMQAISEMNECPDRDYQGWVDFGRRSAE
ncbi:cholecystokinin-like [Oncorhynchus tshawytscha]|uniref:cholecystokinin-like n=1 Tax=Oncorhynchus tshawytscha TaxID=74940 RepID=UPI000D09955C|nr:cholecystokinin-like [Oncorhynchus tshawytscha]